MVEKESNKNSIQEQQWEYLNQGVGYPQADTHLGLALNNTVLLPNVSAKDSAVNKHNLTTPFSEPMNKNSELWHENAHKCWREKKAQQGEKHSTIITRVKNITQSKQNIAEFVFNPVFQSVPPLPNQQSRTVYVYNIIRLPPLKAWLLFLTPFYTAIHLSSLFLL